MSPRLLAAAWREVRPVLLWQAVALIVLPASFAAAMSARAGLAALVGGGIGFASTAYLMIALLKRSLHPGISVSMAGLFANWLIKATVTLCLLVLALRSRAWPPLPVLAGLFGSMVAYWLAIVTSREKHASNVHGK